VKELAVSLQEKLDAVKADAIENTPERLRVIIDNALWSLIASGQAARAMKAGERAPAFLLPDTFGRIVRSEDLLRRGPLVLTFYRGSWCPYCNLDLQALEAAYADIRTIGGLLVTVSQQTPTSSQIARKTNGVTFPMLSDKAGTLANAFGIRSILPADLQSVFKELSIDLPALNGETSWTLPMPARYVIGRDGIIAYAEINPDHTQRPEPSELLPTLRRLTRQSPN
jgi:peroxiredoxin